MISEGLRQGVAGPRAGRVSGGDSAKEYDDIATKNARTRPVGGKIVRGEGLRRRQAVAYRLGRVDIDSNRTGRKSQRSSPGRSAVLARSRTSAVRECAAGYSRGRSACQDVSGSPSRGWMPLGLGPEARATPAAARAISETAGFREDDGRPSPGPAHLAAQAGRGAALGGPPRPSNRAVPDPGPRRVEAQGRARFTAKGGRDGRPPSTSMPVQASPGVRASRGGTMAAARAS